VGRHLGVVVAVGLAVGRQGLLDQLARGRQLAESRLVRTTDAVAPICYLPVIDCSRGSSGGLASW
jgi:hypothetical protein